MQAHIPQIIVSFAKEHDYLSNFYWLPSPLLWDGDLYPTVEHAYQATKTVDPYERIEVRTATSPGYAKWLGRRVAMRPDWDFIELAVMHELLRLKFGLDPLKSRLLATGTAGLVEGNARGDTFWGRCRTVGGDWVGENWLGRLLMLVRSELWRT